MAKVKEQTPLEQATWEREELWKRREKILRNITAMEQREEELRNKLVTLTDAERREFTELRRDLPLEHEILAEVEAKGKERDQTIEQLTREQRRTEAATAVSKAEVEFPDLMQTFDTTDLEAWLKEATEAHGLSGAAHREDSPLIRASSNYRLEAMRTGGQELWTLITRLRNM